jgi:hypothetical protein
MAANQVLPNPDDIALLLSALVVFVFGILPIISILGGIALDRLVQRAAPIVNPLTATLLIGVYVAAAALLVVIGPSFPNSVGGFVAALLVSLAAPSVIALGLGLVFWRRFRSDAARLGSDDRFTVLGEDVRERRKNLRRR